jgi:ribosomal protein S18 acetylase RimI-like enzyme
MQGEWRTKPSGLAYRAARIADSVMIADLVSNLGYPTSPRQMEVRLQTIFADSSYATFVALLDSKVLGFVGLHVGLLYENDNQYGQIMAIAISRDYRRMGIGRRLMHLAEETMAQMGAQIFVLGSGNHRIDAHAFYEALGYEFTGRRYVKTVKS